MARLAFCDYHNMIAILEKYEHNFDFHQIVDFVEASHLRIETTNEGTKILATVDGTPTEPHHTPTPEATPSPQHELSSSSLPHAITETIPIVIPTDNPPLRQYTRRTRIAQSSVLPPVADEPASPIGDDSQGEACPTVSGLEAKQDKVNIIKTSTLPSDSTPRVTSFVADEGSMQHKLTKLADLCTRLQRQQDEMASKITAQDLEISQLKARVKLLEDREGGGIAQSGEDAPIKGMSLDEGEDAAIERSTEKGSNDTEEMINFLTSLDATTVLSREVSVSISPVTEVYVAKVPTGSGSIPTASPHGTGVPTSSDVVPTASPIFTTATVATPYTRRKGKEKMVESDTPKKKKLQEQIDVQVVRELEEEMVRDAQRMNEQIAKDAKIARIHAEEELQMMIDGLDRNNETKAKLVKGMTLEEIKEKFDLVWKQMQDFIPMGSKEEGERFKRKGLRLEHDSAKKVKTLEEVTEKNLKEMMRLIPVEEVYVEALQVKHPIIDWEVHTERQRSYWKIIRLGGSTASYQFFMDLLKHFDREDLNQLWALVKETLNIRQATSDKEKELWSEHNIDFHPIVDFVEASPLRIETTKEGTKILATVDGILRTVTESSLRRNLKLKDKKGISSLPDAELFENLTLMGYNISPNQSFTFQNSQFSHQWKYLILTIMQCMSPKSTGFNEFSSNIATALKTYQETLWPMFSQGFLLRKSSTASIMIVHNLRQKCAMNMRKRCPDLKYNVESMKVLDHMKTLLKVEGMVLIYISDLRIFQADVYSFCRLEYANVGIMIVHNLRQKCAINMRKRCPDLKYSVESIKVLDHMKTLLKVKGMVLIYI
nr:hypothetical protein [Tanacetum cinerariifolium]